MITYCFKRWFYKNSIVSEFFVSILGTWRKKQVKVKVSMLKLY